MSALNPSQKPLAPGLVRDVPVCVHTAPRECARQLLPCPPQRGSALPSFPLQLQKDLGAFLNFPPTLLCTVARRARGLLAARLPLSSREQPALIVCEVLAEGWV